MTSILLGVLAFTAAPLCVQRAVLAPACETMARCRAAERWALMLMYEEARRSGGEWALMSRLLCGQLCALCASGLLLHVREAQ